MVKYKKIMMLVVMAVAALTVQAQSAAETGTDLMHSNGKIYVVIACVVTILAGMFVYLLALDRKISKMEKKG
ncbi:CcmD family protein [Sediminibacterium ginsengisoli]|uniref:CcmD family protein n=1 Tax=Sediminibacterium ginsengisoli TaxID=413434 RepID=A0A1T4QDJ0_9BACT|nr:hypothetical protein [Sediminibacterium ginsengisoli]SKA01880.1 hypothetical protein SAMN04488132_10868 [Sediminibacterium ginsengisoli]